MLIYDCCHIYSISTVLKLGMQLSRQLCLLLGIRLKLRPCNYLLAAVISRYDMHMQMMHSLTCGLAIILDNIEAVALKTVKLCLAYALCQLQHLL